MLASSGLSETFEYCAVHSTDHRSDHKAIQAHFVIDTTEYEENRRKRMYDKADWKKIHEAVSTTKGSERRGKRTLAVVDTSDRLFT